MSEDEVKSGPDNDSPTQDTDMQSEYPGDELGEESEEPTMVGAPPLLEESGEPEPPADEPPPPPVLDDNNDDSDEPERPPEPQQVVQTRPSATSSPAAAQDVAEHFEAQVSVELGRVSMSLKALANLKTGFVLDLGQKPGGMVDLVVGSKVVGQGELVKVDGVLGVRIQSLVK